MRGLQLRADLEAAQAWRQSASVRSSDQESGARGVSREVDLGLTGSPFAEAGRTSGSSACGVYGVNASLSTAVSKYSADDVTLPLRVWNSVR